MKTPFIDLTPLKASTDYARLFIGGSISMIGAQMTLTVVSMHIYAITNSTWNVALIGVVALLPIILAGLYGGVLIDRFDRRKISIYSSISAWLSVVFIAISAFNDVQDLWIYYILTTMSQISSTVVQSTKGAIVPNLLPQNLLAASSALRGISVGIAVTIGPTLGAYIVGIYDFKWAYLADIILCCGNFVGFFLLPPLLPACIKNRHNNPINSVIESFVFVKNSPNIFMSFILDTVAMIFGNPRSIFPAVAATVIGGGPIIVGLLSTASAIGVFLSSVISGKFTHLRYQGKLIIRSIIIYGLSIACFGFVIFFGTLESRNNLNKTNIFLLLAAFICITISGAADNVSSIFRSALLQSATPDYMRGRLQGLFIVASTGSPRLGDFYVGLVASLGFLWIPQLIGGAIIIVIVIILTRKRYKLFSLYDALNPKP